MNPILLYELRQSVRNRSVLLAIMLYLAAMAALTVVVFAGEVSIDHYWDMIPGFHNVFGVSFNGPPNKQLVFALFLLYYLVASAVLMIFGAVKTAFERMSGDLLYTTTLTPGRIVWGKVQLGFVIALLFGSMTLPFLTVAWLGRNVDILEISLTFLFAFTLIQMHYASTLAMFAGATSLIAVYARVFPWFIGQVLLFFFSLMIIFEEPAPTEFVPGLICSAAVLCAVAHLLATVQFAPETANRMFGVRVGLAILVGVSTVGTLIALIFDTSLIRSGPGLWWSGLFVWNYIFLWLLVPYLFLIFICERTEYSNRQRQWIPVTFIGRLIAFPFYSGVANAMVWSAGLVFFGILYLVVSDNCMSGAISSSSGGDPFYGLHTFALMFFNYCATSLLICHLLLRKWMSRRWNWVPVCVLIGTLISVAFISAWLPRSVTEPMWDFLEDYPLLPYPWPSDDNDTAYLQYLYGGIWLIVLCNIGVVWVVLAFRKFRR